VELIEYRILNFRSINDSGPITVGKTTALVGRNESGKSNLHLALAGLNPAGGIKPLNPIKDFPRQRRLAECHDETPVVESKWRLSDKESKDLAVVWPRASGVREVSVSRNYKGASYLIAITPTQKLKLDASSARKAWQPVGGVVEAFESEVEPNLKAALTAARKAVESSLDGFNTTDGAKKLCEAVKSARTAITTAGKSLPATEESSVSALEESARADSEDAGLKANARQWVVKQLPIFVFIDDYPQFDGHQDLVAYQARKAQPNALTAADRNFEKLCKVAGLDPAELVRLQGINDHETRNQLVNRAGAVVTAELRRLWKDRPLKVRFGLDAQHLDTFVSDPNAAYDVEVNLDERSRGLRWFFSFYVTFAADTKGGSAENAVLLLDEPGLFLHARSQGDLLRYLRLDLKNQVIYTTHSPFMVPVDALNEIRTVGIDPDKGTEVSDTPTGDAATLFPLQAALGFDLAQSLFVGPNNLIVEGVTDYWILTAISEYLRSEGASALPADVTITPAGGAQKIVYLVALLTSERLKVIVLLDDEPFAKRTRDELIKAKLIRDDCVIFTSIAFAAPVPSEADIEDLLDQAVYDDLVRTTYAAELAGKTLTLNHNIPRIVKRYEDAFASIGIEFHKTRAARLFLDEMASNPTGILTVESRARFARIFESISAQFARQSARASEPFH
jgi:energy-coupling factor transporter ATP-binding protein EcfA2